MKMRIVIGVIAILVSLSLSFMSFAETKDSSDLKPYIESVKQAKEGMTLWEMIKNGGWVMFILFLLSIGALALIVYHFITLKLSYISPREFAEEVVHKLEQGKGKAVEALCSPRDNLIASMVMAGLERKPKGAVFAREAMESCLRKEVGKLWQNLSYLADISAIAPLVGLLGTVLGMIQAFNVIAFKTAVVKPILLAGGVSKAMVTTAGGLIVAIPAMLFYAYFKGKLQEIVDVVEGYGSDIIKIVEES